MSFKFEDLKVWQKAIELSGNVHDVTRSFPSEERYVLTSQFKRAADSVALNVAERSTGQSDAEFAKFIGYSHRSAIEVVCCLHLGKRRDLVSGHQFSNLYGQCEEITRMLSGLRNSLTP